MTRSGLATLVAVLVTMVAPLASADDQASVARGGRLYDNWSLESRGRFPNNPNPAFKTQQVRVAAPDTWRCVECHGWDYKGNHGVVGIGGRQKADPAAIAAILNDANHGYSELLDDADRHDLANFVIGGQTDMRRLVDAAKRIRPNQGNSEKVFATICANCHGLEGDRLRQIPPLGDAARQRPMEVLHTAINGHPGGNMPAMRTLGEDAAVNMLVFLQTLRTINVTSSIANGGRLYDDWQVHTGGQRQALPHPAYPPKASFINLATETWRCKECHGWDYKGNQGAYSKGEHATGIKGIRAMAGAEPDKIVAILRNSAHLFGAVLKHRDLQDLANFVSSGQIDMDTAIDPRTGAARGSAAQGEKHYQTMCAACHGREGRFTAKRHLGKASRDDPWHSLHNMLNGHPDDAMPALRELDPKVTNDILAYIQTLQERR